MAADQADLFTPVTVIVSLPSMVCVAWVAARLLGVRHTSLLTALVAGLLGWMFGAVFVLSITGGHTEELNLVLTVLIVVLATMVATVTIDLLRSRVPRRRPLLFVPHPLRAGRTALRRVKRYVQVLRIATRNGLGPYLGLHGDPEQAAAAAASARTAMESAAGVFVKLGQLLAGRADLLPPEARREFARLQERVSPADPRAVAELLERALGAPTAEVFDDFDDVPLAAASIAQAHRARLRTGEEVVVKVQRPGIATVIADDLAITRWLARMTERHTAWGSTYRVTDLADEFANALEEELDFRVEARNIREAARTLCDQPGVVVPRVHEELSSRRVLVLERIGGVALADRPEVTPAESRALADALLRCVVAPMLAGERFHADPHPGNVRLLDDGRIGLLDFGATGRLDAFELASVIDILLAIRGREPALLLDAVRQVTVIPSDVDERQLEHALARFLARHVTVETMPNASMLTELLRVFLVHGIALPAGTTTMFRSLVTLQGTLELICPGYPLIDAAQNLAGTLIIRHPSPRTVVELAEQELLSSAPLLRRVPRHLDRIAAQLERGDLRIQTRLFGDRRDERLVTRLMGQLVLTLAAATAGGVSVALLALGGGPLIASGVTMQQAFGYAGLTLSLVLLLRVVATALRDQSSH